ncbi:amino acid ABC transporter permease [Citrobacter farmeri]|uniref:amino acid ABC transporter permease n=1 Tax=Citrobacter farmeri TaxID=67824 RepID=UPI002298C70E|nr:amino acid ABC transporter permease [Citrobacter farmeri]MEC3930025.1 amino acid ABC transporter permease [Citrobacter farmeri]HCW7015450.1 amino acid ABC transporter permease [Citrobacter farmeri]HCW7019084.1 amino acid ABC transporter permease [Citrobacter farmeri]HEM8560921.1 amino acid ABC transporter permease [Citrobacter farmeri]HEM8565130.1 amino acid ABC transporter permease [Citrobacter farmeri]
MNFPLNFAHIQFLLEGTLWTIVLSLMAFGGGGIMGFLIALGRIAPVRAIRLVISAWVQFIQGTPLLIIMFMVYFGLPQLGMTISPLLAAGLSLTIYASAYLGEIWRGCIQAVPRAQWEAAECLALSSTQRMFNVILPQAIKLATPPTVGFSVQIIKNTSLASVVGFVELARAGQLINNSIFEPFIIYLIVAALYFCLCFPVSVLSRRLEQGAPEKKVKPVPTISPRIN